MAVTLLSPFRSSISAVAVIALVAGSLAAPLPAGAQSHGPESVADLAEPLLDAVVNISTSQNVKTDGKGPVPPRLPEGSPFQEFFKDYFDSQKPEGGEKVNSLGSGFVIDPAGYVVTTTSSRVPMPSRRFSRMARSSRRRLSAPIPRPIFPF